MTSLPARFRPATDPIAPAASIVRGDHFRITMLTERLVRLEWSASGAFEDRPTQVVLDRAFEACEFTVGDDADGVRIDTPHLRLGYDRRPFSPSGLSVRIVGSRRHRATWRFGEQLPVERVGGGNRGGTARTLDDVDGEVDLEPGLLSGMGWAVVDDTRSLALTDDGWVAPSVRGPDDVDLYLFAYGDDAEACLRDFYRLTGPQPMLPRFALGNWWSRYHPYTADEYRALFERFEHDDLPFGVAVLDMDWHLVDIPTEFGIGWTGYTWNRELVPDPPALLAWLHEHGLRVTLNVHPADGVRAFEEPYERLAAALGRPADGRPIDFDIASPDFAMAYLEQVHHPLEDEGVDFWWLDWQQGHWSRMPGLDPLWMLNHLHFLDSARTGRRPLTFSRYAGVGSHRYPVGFSGDTVVSWASLDFQPSFTSTAANIGFGWWSHDVGGHLGGVKDDELATRWVQLGVFSPILRLHSTADRFHSKEPWRFGPEYEGAMGRWLRIRHRLVPYLFTMNHRAHVDGVPLVRPLRHTHPTPEADTNPNQFWFGSSLLVAPITSPRDPASGLGAARAWLPPGTWVDVFTGVVYEGDRVLTLHRPLDGYPVLAPAGAIVPLTRAGDHDLANPSGFEIVVVGGADGSFCVYEDDDAAEPRSVTTTIDVDWSAGRIVIRAAEGDLDVVPAKRTVTITLVGVAPNAAESLPSAYDAATARLTIEVGEVATATGATVRLSSPPRLAADGAPDRVRELIDRAEIAFADKDRVDRITSSGRSTARQLADLLALDLDPALRDAVVELVAARPG